MRSIAAARWITVTALRAYRPTDLPAVIALWNRTFDGGPNFTRISENDFLNRVIRQPSFAPEGLLVASNRDELAGFVHLGPATNFWFELAERQVNPSEGLIWAVVASDSDRATLRALLEAALERLSGAGARRVLLYPSWVQCTQPFYNGIAGAYEMPGLASSRHGLIALATDLGFAPIAHYATPELALSDVRHLAALRQEADRIWARLRGLDLQQRTREVTSVFFPPRRAVALMWGLDTVATTAYGLWEEYAREHRRAIYGITGVQVAKPWRGRGLGKLIVVLALESALAEGAEALHLHVYQGNAPAWNLYHRALGFQPKHTWLTLAREL